MKNWVKRNYKSIIISAFLIPIITVAIVSISHVTIWYGISNPISWAIYLSIGIEIAALSALAAISADMGSKVYFPFGVVTLIQFIGNIYFSYQFIDLDGKTFKEWVELVSPLLEYIGVESNDYVGHKRFLSLFAGGMLPIISLSFLHMLVKFTQENKFASQESNNNIEKESVVDSKDLVSEISRLRLSENDLQKISDALINPPQPNEALKNAAKMYKEILKEPYPGPPQRENEYIYSVKDEEPKEELFDDDLNTYNDYVDYIKKENSQITDSVTTQNQTEPVKEDTEPAQPVAIEELPENQPLPDSPSPAIDNLEEKKKNQ